VKDMLAAEFCIKIVEREAERRDKKELAIWTVKFVGQMIQASIS
jgi:hypothetical protein